MSAAQARERFAAARVARLATVDETGQPHLVPIVFALDGDRILSVVDDKPKRTTALRRLANIEQNSRVAVLVDHYDEDWDALWWARADGRARILDVRDGEARHAIDLLRERYPQQRAVGAVVVVDVERWVGWSSR